MSPRQQTLEHAYFKGLTVATAAALGHDESRTSRRSTGAPMQEKRTTRADRETIADLLSRHYAAGSLEIDEFNERLDKAMTAKFPSALAALHADLPYLPAEQVVVPPPAHARGLTRVAYRDWKVQNVLAVAAVLGALTLAGSHPGAMVSVAILICVLVNGALGWRKSKGFAVIGVLSSPFSILGTVLMIALTWRKQRS